MARRLKLLRQVIGVISIILVLGLLMTPPIQCFLSIPDQLNMGVGDKLQFLNQLPVSWLEKIELQLNRVSPDPQNRYGLNYGTELKSNMGDQVSLEPGKFNLVLKLYGLIPLKKMTVTVASPTYVVPGGQSIGIKVNEGGILVKDYSQVLDNNGKDECPAQQMGIKPGDMILEADGVKVTNEWELAEIVNKAGCEQRAISLIVERDNKKWEMKITPIYCNYNHRFRIGLMVKDNLAGVGTLTFYDPQTKVYGALGHMIVDNSTNRPPEIKRGKMFHAPIQSIEPGRRGKPGEKIGLLNEELGMIGTIESNCEFGVYGRLVQDVSNPIYPKPIPVAWHNQIEIGPATMLTVIKGEEIQEYAINIEKVFSDNAGEKGIIVRVTDTRLLESTGGIIQGMSGSPVLQGGRLVGAITHVFINDPTKGYALSAENMIESIKSIRFSTGGNSPGFF